ncbi:MXAN_6230/SCO0854 family RING domain-containing protein [Streptomyces sp. NPDC015125]|uniref:MXAN_6230/SCO0854 family RING domain-containing protein n=1 Tax=Streptomyces sp. NPDC015125 TaxID=3364938 RepID=UPI0037002235
MTTKTVSDTTRSHCTLPAVLLARRGSVYLPSSTGRPTLETQAGVALLEAELLERGYLLSAGLRQVLTELDADTLTAQGRALLADIDNALGADRDHTPLFRGFPETTPNDTLAFYAERVLTVLLQAPNQPCVLCGTENSVQAVSPCAHLICHTCFDGTDFSACPICHRKLDADEPFLRPQRAQPSSRAGRALPTRLRVLSHGGDYTARSGDAGHELDALLSRNGALSPQDADDLAVLLETRDQTDLAWLPSEIPGREIKAIVLSWLLADSTVYEVTLPALSSRLTTATDILRLLAVRSGGDAGLVDMPRLTAVPRPLRRALLSVLDNLSPALAAEDMHRHPVAWKRAAERLHPFEYATRYPNAALIIAALREFRLTSDSFSQQLRNTAQNLPAVTATTKITLPLWASKVETALANNDIAAAVPLLAQRPGELLRRLDHLLRLTQTHEDGANDVLSAVEKALGHVSPAVLLSALGEIRTRARKGADRVYFPKGGAKAHIVDDERPPLSAHLVDRAVRIMTDEVLRRTSQLPPVDTAVIDAALDGVIAPFAERSFSRALMTLPRGSELAVPAGQTVRLFLHWMESDTSGRTDLDLSTALFSSDWSHVGTCDWTNLRYERNAAVHSGDLTSAPAPRGASEFVDLDLGKLAAAGVRYVIASVFSYNNVAFDDLDEAFAGLMVRDDTAEDEDAFDPRQVEQRFDLTGRARASVPMVIDVVGRTMRWLDVVQAVTGTNHAVHRHANTLATLGAGLTGLFASGARVSLGELATWQASGRANTVAIRHIDDSVSVYQRRTDEAVAAFAARIGTPEVDRDTDVDINEAQLAYVLRGDLSLPSGSEAFALYPGALDAGRVNLLAASDLLNALA